MYKYEVLEIVKATVSLCTDDEVWNICGTCPLQSFCNTHKNNSQKEK